MAVLPASSGGGTATVSGTVTVAGDVASGVADSGNPVKVGGKYNATKPSVADAQRSDLQLGARGSTCVEIRLPDSSVSASSFTDTDAIGSLNTYALLAYNHLFNGTTHDRERANVEATLLASAARTATTSSSDQTNYNGRGVAIVTSVTVEGAATLTLTVQGKDSIAGTYYELITGVIVYTAATDAPPTQRAIILYPGIVAANLVGISGNGSQGLALPVPRTWRVTITPADATTTTYSVSGVTIL